MCYYAGSLVNAHGLGVSGLGEGVTPMIYVVVGCIFCVFCITIALLYCIIVKVKRQSSTAG